MTPDELQAHIDSVVALAQKNGQHMALANMSALLLQDEQASVPCSLQRVIAHMSTVSKNAGDVDD